MSIPPASARIWGYVASAAPRIVLLRRGPSRWVQMYVWNAETDEIQAGSWFKGNIYYMGCDISPNGEHFIYHAANSSPSRQPKIIEALGIDELDEWFSLCQPPYFTSLGVWKTYCGLGSGYFRNNHAIVFDAHDIQKRELRSPPSPFRIVGNKEAEPLKMSMYRSGWHPTQKTSLISWQSGELYKGDLSLKWDDRFSFSVARAHEYTYKYPGVDLSGVSWADLDHRGELVYARAGYLFRHTPDGERFIANLNNSQPNRPWLDNKRKNRPERRPIF